MDMERRIRVALFSKYERLGASSRVRSYQYLPDLAANGIDVDTFPLFDDGYIRYLYQDKRRSLKRVVLRYMKRFYDICRATDYDVFWIEKELLPYVPAWVERICGGRRPILVDYDDAIFHNYDSSHSRLVRAVLSGKIDGVMRQASIVTCGNEYLADRARSAGAHRVVRVPSVVDINRYDVSEPCENAVPVIGWIGTPSTQHYLLPIKAALQEVCRGGRARVIMVGASESFARAMLPVPVEIRPWNEATEPTDIACFDVGIMPLDDGPFERGKCGYKLIQYMAAGRPVVASPVGVNVELVARTGSGLLASSQAEWREALDTLVAQPALRRTLGDSGRVAVAASYSLHSQARRLAGILRGLGTESGSSSRRGALH